MLDSKAFKLLLLAYVVNSAALMIIVFINLDLSQQHFSLARIGALNTLFGIGGIIGSMGSGKLSKYIAPLTIAKLSACINATTLICFPFCHSFGVLIVLILLMGIANNSFRPACLVLFLEANNTSSSRTKMSYPTVAMNIGMSIGISLTGFVFEKSMHLAFIINGLCVIGSFVLLTKIQVKRSVLATAVGSSGHDKLSSGNNYFELALGSAILLIGLLIYSQQNATYGIFLVQYLHYTHVQISHLFVLNGLLVMLLQIPLNNRLKRLSPYSIGSLGLLLIGCGFSMILLPGGLVIGLISCVFWTIGEILLFPSIVEIMLINSATNKFRVMSIYMTVSAVGRLLAAPLGFYIYSFSPVALWWCCLVASLAGVTILLKARLRKPAVAIS